ncbi:pyridoxamine 5'-phosphate oxidase family protein [Sedimenticola sp.]|uniref:pyridoxamine 5'-phosphate oxidase family protein n=1 Tax=Sedimenticola sp. TaxID=1940285 RepID=UPI00258977D4|nr:pyridoxamine 5'-phosphate oxidase family protein [Sedimenticola sp.]MCW8902204.1 pyridoxamine 5'-phosphate oxidase family protein [Sedimenticola sp.]
MLIQAPVTPILDEATAAFIQHFVSINVSTANGHRQPAISRAYGCRVADDLTRVTLFIYRDRSRQLLQGVHENHTVAVVFSRPSTLETLQLKGHDATPVEMTTTDLEYMDRYRESFMRELRLIGFPDTFATAMMACYGDEMLGIRFTPDAVFVATPGPRAGKPLSP